MNPANSVGSLAAPCPKTPTSSSATLFGSTVLERIDDKILADWAPELVFVEGPGE
jgi:hypothetical protein